MTRYADKRYQHVVSAFNKLASILPSPLAQHVHASVAAMGKRPRKDNYERIFGLLATAWAGCRKVRITYPWTHPDGRLFINERVVAPYILEPNASGHSCYLIGDDRYSNQVRTFKVERIQSAELTAETYEVPTEFNLDQRLQHALGISDEDLVQVRLRFLNPTAPRRADETRWHPRNWLPRTPTARLTFRTKSVGCSRSRLGCSAGATRSRCVRRPKCGPCTPSRV